MENKRGKKTRIYVWWLWTNWEAAESLKIRENQQTTKRRERPKTCLWLNSSACKPTDRHLNHPSFRHLSTVQIRRYLQEKRKSWITPTRNGKQDLSLIGWYFLCAIYSSIIQQQPTKFHAKKKTRALRLLYVKNGTLKNRCNVCKVYLRLYLNRTDDACPD